MDQEGSSDRAVQEGCELCLLHYMCRTHQCGRWRVERHSKHKNTTKHIELVKQSKGQTEVSSYFQESTSNSDKVIRAETLLAQFVTEHNLPFSAADHYTQLAVQIFPDSEVARNLSCARTKTTCIIKGALAPHVFEKVLTQCQNQPFSVLVDKSNDRACDKEVAILVRVWDDDIRRVVIYKIPQYACV